MSDLTPITREEALLDGADLEPITRKEQFIKRIYDETQEIPDPITREEWFLKKAGEGTSPVAIEQLNATENGTYREEGKAYSPVIVEVPQTTVESLNITANGTYTAPSGKAYSPVTVNVEGFKKKSIANTPTDIASFNDGTANPMPSLEISIEPVQSGSGDPSPSNVRPISGWSGAQITVTDDLTTPTETHTLSIPFHDSSDNPITVYGGTLNVTSGELTVKWIAVSLDNINYTKSPSGLFQTNEIANAVKKGSSSYTPTGFIKSSHFCEIDSASITGPQGSNPSPDGVMAVSSSGILYINYLEATDIADFKTAMASATFIYELATPITYQLTPTQVTTLLDQNNIFADCGQILEGEYFVTL